MEKMIYERPVIKKIVTNMPDKFGSRIRVEPQEEIDGIKVKDLAANNGSPLFVFSEKTIRETYKDAKRAFTTRYPKVQFAWSYKTNYLSAICNIFHQEGAWAEVVSGFEYDKASANGVPGNKIIYNGPEKTASDLIKAVEDEALIHIDNFDELYTLIELTEKMKKKPKVAIRVNMDTGIYPKWSRFGFSYENGEAWEALNRIMLSKKLELLGLHCHIGTYIFSAKPYGVAASKLAELASKLIKKYNYHIKYIDMGGGFASKNTLKGSYLPGVDTCPSFEEYADEITSGIIKAELDQDNMPILILETGRALIDDAGFILGTVMANKRSADNRRNLIINVGVNLLFTAFWYDHEVVPGQICSPHVENCIIYGPLCMNIDVIRDFIPFPNLSKGDLVVVKRTGAYNVTQWLQFITTRPKIVLIDMKGKAHVIRESENLEYISSLENTPEYLKEFKI